MHKTHWQIDTERNGYRGFLYIIRKWIFSDKPPLVERKFIHVSDIPLYVH